MKVDMKGMSEKVELFDIIGIGTPFDLKLIEKKIELQKLEHPLDADLYPLDKKIVSKKAFPSRITSLGLKNGVISTPKELKVLDNVRLHLYENGSCQDEAQVYAKVSQVEKSQGNHLVSLDFTAVTPDAEKVISHSLSG